MTPKPHDEPLLEALLNSWDRNNAILINLLRLIPDDQLHTRVIESSPSVVEWFNHMHYVRLIFLTEDAPDFARALPERDPSTGKRVVQHDPARLEHMLNESAKALRDAVKSKIETGGQMDLHYDHPILFLQHMIWHEGYHHGQIKLALKLAGHPLTDDEAGTVTWDIWMDKSNS